MSSLASVNVMLALEGEFNIEFPDQMLNRSVFEHRRHHRRRAQAEWRLRARPARAAPDRSSRMMPSRNQGAIELLEAIRTTVVPIAARHAAEVDKRPRGSRTKASRRCVPRARCRPPCRVNSADRAAACANSRCNAPPLPRAAAPAA